VANTQVKYSERDYLENKIIMINMRLWFDQMSREDRYITDDELINLQLQHKRMYGCFYEVKQYDFSIVKQKRKI